MTLLQEIQAAFDAFVVGADNQLRNIELHSTGYATPEGRAIFYSGGTHGFLTNGRAVDVAVPNRAPENPSILDSRQTLAATPDGTSLVAFGDNAQDKVIELYNRAGNPYDAEAYKAVDDFDEFRSQVMAEAFDKASAEFAAQARGKVTTIVGDFSSVDSMRNSVFYRAELPVLLGGQYTSPVDGKTVTTHPCGVSGHAGVRVARIAWRAQCPLMRPVPTMEQRSA